MDTNGKLKKYRHGDVIIKEVAMFPKGTRIEDEQTKDRILAYGEATGHKHWLVNPKTAPLCFKVGDDVFFEINSPTTVDHPEHGPKTLPPGMYRARVAREKDHLSGLVRRIAD